MNRPKILLYLHHVELGQRYPISEDVIIGRHTGHICFPKDERLSKQHCRIFHDEKDNLFIRDLGSDHGTVVDGRLLSPEKSYPIKDGTNIAVGSQIFKCVEPRQRPVRKKKRFKSAGADYTWLFFLVLAVAAGALAAQFQKPIMPKVRYLTGAAVKFAKSQLPEPPEPPPPPIASPFELVYKDIEGAYDQYGHIGQEVQSGAMDSKAMAAEFRESLIPKFQAAQSKLQVLKPTNELERRRIEANSRLVSAILKQITAMASFAETKNKKYDEEVQKIMPEVEAANEEARKLNNQRVPAAEN